ncbi:ABC transporter ATP-binding protein [Roseomonas sp. USHLN139]|uniref:ABC transporter ATP-binding protein n=1 Tax=Roseomonas sp. USHLN139 TaxID=3081298 RepID=UPI003B021668
MMLELDSLSAHYGSVEVFSNVSLRIAAGEKVALLGRNGAGKTTLVQALFNLGPRLSGTIRLRGEAVQDWPTHRIARRGMALVPQGRGLFPTLSVTENLRLATLRQPRGEWTLEKIFETFPRLAERRQASSSALSGGERQLLAIGRALLTQAPLLVLDEPSEGLAPMMAEEIIVQHVGRLAEAGLTVLLAEQNAALALRLCPRALVLSGRRLVFDGPSEALLADRALLQEHLGV